jgi:hypothetical protein
MNLKLNEKTSNLLKKAVNYLLLSISLILGYVIGYNIHNLKNKQIETKNPYSSIYSTNDISIALDDNQNMLLIDRSNGQYTVFTDSVGITIFQLYANSIYKNVIKEDTNE